MNSIPKIILYIPVILLVIFYCVLFSFNYPLSWAWWIDVPLFKLSNFVSSVFFDSYLIELIVLLFILVLMLYKPVKDFIKKDILIRGILFILISIIIILPFSKGKEFNETEEVGLKLISILNEYEKNNEKYPTDLAELKSSFTPLEYEILTHDFKYELESNSSRTSSFHVSFKPKWLRDVRFVYIKRENKFIAFD